jgi:putative tricarboxylic transport membrane protein
VRSADRIAGAALLALAVGFSAGALKEYTYWGENGPGSAFLPFWIGVVMALLATLLLVGALRSRDPGEPWLPRGEGLQRIAIVLGATTAYVALIGVLGMTLATALFLVVLVRWPDRKPWPVAIAVAVAMAALNYVVFTRWLHVPLPTGPFGL